MAQRCKVCNHQKLEEINKKLIKTQNIARIADEYFLSYDSLYRHNKNHLPEHLSKAKNADDLANAGSLLEQLEELRTKSWDLLNKAEQAGDLRTALAGIREAKGCLELLAKIKGGNSDPGIYTDFQLEQTKKEIVEIVSEEVGNIVILARIAERLKGVS